MTRLPFQSCFALLFSLGLLSPEVAGASPKKKKDPQPSALDVYIQQAKQRAGAASNDSPGSLFAGPGVLGEMAMDLRARGIDDVVTIVVNESANAVSTGTTKTQRQSTAVAGISALAGTTSASGPLANLLNTNNNTQLNGQGTTSRQTTLSTNLTARVVDVLPNGYLVIQGSKQVMINSENQTITLRGVIRPTDLTTANIVQSDSIAQLELQLNGKGVVNDAVKRPNILYRLLLGILPF